MKAFWLGGGIASALIGLSLAQVLNQEVPTGQLSNDQAGKIFQTYHRPNQGLANIVGFGSLAFAVYAIAYKGMQEDPKPQLDEDGEELGSTEMNLLHAVEQLQYEQEALNKRRAALRKVAQTLAGDIEDSNVLPIKQPVSSGSDTPKEEESTAPTRKRRKKKEEAKKIPSGDDFFTGEHDWMKSIVETPLKVISGVQGSGKSSLERCLMWHLKKCGYHVVVINPATTESVWKGIEVIKDVEQINTLFKNFHSMIDKRVAEADSKKIDEDKYLNYLESNAGNRDRGHGKVAFIIQEANSYKSRKVDLEAFGSFMELCLTDIRKWGFTAVITGQSKTMSTLCPKLKGFSDLLKSQTTLIGEAKRDPNGKSVATGRVEVHPDGPIEKTMDWRKYPNFTSKNFLLPEENQEIYENFSILKALLTDSQHPARPGFDDLDRDVWGDDVA